MPLRSPVLACFGCGKANVRYWREREGLVLSTADDIRARIEQIEDLDTSGLSFPLTEPVADELIAQLIRSYSIKYNGITHQEAMELVMLFYTRDM